MNIELELGGIYAERKNEAELAKLWRIQTLAGNTTAALRDVWDLFYEE